MHYSIPVVLVPLLFIISVRVLSSKANYYLHTVNFSGSKHVIYITMGNVRFLLISIFCSDKNVAKKVYIISVLSLLNMILMSISALLTHLFAILYLPIVFWTLGSVLLVVALAAAKLTDRNVWTIWGTKKDNCNSDLSIYCKKDK